MSGAFKVLNLKVMPRRSRNGRRDRNNTTVPRNSGIRDLAHFSARTKFKYARTITGLSNSSGSLVTVLPRGTLSGGISGVDSLVNAFPSVRLLNIQIFFDARGVDNASATNQVGVFRAGAFMLQGPPSNYDAAKTSALGDWGGRGLTHTDPSKALSVKIGPEFSAGRFASPTVTTPSDTLLINTLGYNGEIRLVFVVEALGTPEDISAL